MDDYRIQEKKKCLGFLMETFGRENVAQNETFTPTVVSLEPVSPLLLLRKDPEQKEGNHDVEKPAERTSVLF